MGSVRSEMKYRHDPRDICSTTNLERHPNDKKVLHRNKVVTIFPPHLMSTLALVPKSSPLVRKAEAELAMLEGPTSGPLLFQGCMGSQHVPTEAVPRLAGRCCCFIMTVTQPFHQAHTLERRVTRPKANDKLDP
jgi:hypothetical protein